MAACPACGRENPDGFRFCGFCSSPLANEAGREVRKTVTVLFSDVTGSTALGERLDPESVRKVMGRYFAEAKKVIGLHGGTVEKFIGDAVMAVFGIPAVHEDDALRAVRAAAEIRDALERLNEELSREFGVEVSVRTGVNTGMVVAGDPATGQTLVTGDTVNTAARLEQTAVPGEILLGERTFRLVRDAVSVEPVAPLDLKGKARPVPAFRLLEVSPAVPERRPDSPMIGRDGELAALHDAFEKVVAERRCRLCTVIGQAGIGKSRLVQELVASLGQRTQVLRGRVLSYGEGITFWPIGEIVRDAAAIAEDDTPEHALRKIARLIPGEGGPGIAESVGSLIGLGETVGSEAEAFSAVRKLLESLARQRPLLMVVEDLHWAEPTLLDLLEHVALGVSEDAPILLVCTARPELTEARAGWAKNAPQPLTVALEPLDTGTSQELMSNLLGGMEIPGDVGWRISEAADGNPLFIEEIFSMLVDDGWLAREDGRWVVIGDLSTVQVPPTIQALLSARIDRLDLEERAVLERASVVGKVFYWSAVNELFPEAARERVGSQLLSLARKAFVLPTASDLAGEDAYGFRHILIRDAAYDGIPKTTRAELHELMARWLEQRGERLTELEEIVGYHLERAFGYRAELGAAEPWRGLAEKAAEHLGSSGRRALARRDLPAATGLLERTRSLLAAGTPAHRQIGLDLASALAASGAFERARVVLEEVASNATADGDELHAAHARLDLAEIKMFVDPEGAAEQARVQADAAMPVFEEAVDDLGIAKAWRLRGEPDHMLARMEPYRQVVERALEHLRRAGDRSGTLDVLATIAHSVTVGPMPIPEAIARMEAILDEASDSRELRARVRVRMGFVLAQQGREREALEAEAEADAILEDLGVEFFFGSYGLMAGELEGFLGRFGRAEQLLRRSDAIFERAGEQSVRSTVLAVLAGVLVDDGRMAEAEEAARLGLELGSSDDLATLVHAHRALGRVLGSRGDPQAEETARRAVAIAEETDLLCQQGETWNDLGLILLSQGRDEEAEEALRNSVDRFERKGATALANRVRARIS